MLKLLALVALLAAAAAAPSDYPQILELKKTGSTPTSVTLTWTLDASQFEPRIYTLVIDGILTVQFFYDGLNTYTASGLQPCKLYTFDLTATYEGGEQGETASISGSTDYENPGAVGDLSAAGSVITWTAPPNAQCVDFYTVCHTSTVTGDSDCMEGVITTTYDLGVLSACDELDVTVYAVGGDITGEPSTVHVITQDGVPGKVRDVEVVPLSETSVLLAWNPPLENPACVQDYALVYGPVNNFTVTEVAFENEVSTTEDKEDEGEKDVRAVGPHGQSETAILDNLFACTDYRFGVAAVSDDNDYSEEVVVFLSTNDSAPGIIPDVVFTPGLDSITISWGDVSEEACLHIIQICYIEPVNHTFQCVEVPSTPNTWTLSGLGACREYEFIISGVSPGGSSGEPIVITVPTTDRAPGAVQNLALGNVEMASLTVTYDPPIDYPECAEEYIVRYKNILDVLDTRSAGLRDGSFTDNLDGLDACALYEISVSAVSPTGIEGPVSTQRTPMKQGPPEPPSASGGQLLTSTETSLTVLWFAPTDTRFCVDTYEVRVSEDGEGPTQPVEVLNFDQQLVETFTGLNPCTTYMVQIRSINTETNSQSPYAQVLNDAKTLCP